MKKKNKEMSTYEREMQDPRVGGFHRDVRLKLCVQFQISVLPVRRVLANPWTELLDLCKRTDELDVAERAIRRDVIVHTGNMHVNAIVYPE